MITASMMRSARDEFEKIAEEERESGAEQTKRGLKQGLGALAGMLGSAGGTIAMAERNIPEDAALAQKIRDAASKEIPIETTRDPDFFFNDNLSSGNGERLFIREGFANSPGVLAHELGHMEISRNPVGRLLRNKATSSAANVATGIGLVSGALSGLSDDERVQALGRWAPVVAAAPQLAYEGGASLLGLRRMAREGATAGQLLRGAGTLLPAWGLHAARAGMAYANANATQGLVRHLREELNKDEFEKTAEEERESGAEQTKRGLKQGLGALAGIFGSGFGALGMSGRNIAEDATLAQKIRAAASKEIPIESIPDYNAYFAEKDWIPGKGEHIGIGERVAGSPGMLAHELGHMEISRNPVGRLLQNKATILAGTASPVIGAVSGTLSGLSDDERVQALGRWAPVIAAAPQLAYEGGASLLGLRRMAREGATAGQLLRGAGTLLPAWGSYAANAGLGYAAANTTQGLTRHLRDKLSEDEFEKTAKEEEEKRESGVAQIQKGMRQSSKAALLGIGSHLGALAMAGRNIPEDATLAEKIRAAASKEIPIVSVPGQNSYFAEKDWIPGRGEHIGIGTYMDKSPSILAHELGHMEISRNPVGRLLQNKATILAGKSAPVIGSLSGALSGLSDDERVQTLGRWAPVVAAAPQLAYEGGATLLGLRRMSREGATAGQLLRGVGTLLPAWGTYAANAGIGYASANTMQGAMRNLREKNRKINER